MPQLDILTFFPQLFWLIITFACLYVILSRFSLPKLTSISQERDRQISEALAAAEKNKAEAYRLKNEYEEKFKQAVLQKNIMIDTALKEISQMIETKTVEHNSMLNEMINESENKIKDYTIRAFDDIQKIAFDATENILTSILDLKLDKADIQEVINKQSNTSINNAQ